MSSQQKRPQAKAGTAVRLIKTLFSFYPRLLPAVIVCLLVAAVSSSFGSVFLQGALRNPAAADKMGARLIFGFAVTEALGLIAAVVALALAFG